MILKCGTKAKFEQKRLTYSLKTVVGTFEDLELIVTENPCRYAPFSEITQKSSLNSQYS